MRAAQAHSFLHGLSYVTPDSIKSVAPHVLSHRILLNPHREYTGVSSAAVVEKVLSETPVPTMPHETRAKQTDQRLPSKVQD